VSGEQNECPVHGTRCSKAGLDWDCAPEAIRWAERILARQNERDKR
jgi:hypothetical protein